MLVTIPSDESTLAILLANRSNKVEFFVNPEWQSLVDRRDREVVASLLDDFAVRSTVEPMALFRQLESLNFGPLITGEVGLVAHRELQIICLLARFQRR